MKEISKKERKKSMQNSKRRTSLDTVEREREREREKKMEG